MTENLGLPRAPAIEPLDLEDRNTLARCVGFAINGALVAYYQACNDVGDKVRETTQASHGFLDLLVDLVAGALLPGISTRVVGRIMQVLVGESGSAVAL